MPPKSTLKPIIVEKAILLFGERGLWGVTIDALTEAAGVGKASVYRLCDSIEQLHEEAFQQVTSQAQAQLSKILVGIKNQDAKYYIAEAARQWYQSMPQATARFLQQVMIQDKKRRDQAYAPLGQIITALTAVLEREVTAKTAARAKEKVENLIWALFHYKLMRPAKMAAKEEKTKVDAKIRQWLQDVMPGR
jgi:AcrR family transcriptional regulator